MYKICISDHSYLAESHRQTLWTRSPNPITHEDEMEDCAEPTTKEVPEAFFQFCFFLTKNLGSFGTHKSRSLYWRKEKHQDRDIYCFLLSFTVA